MMDLTNMPQLIVAYDSDSELADLIHISKAELGKDYYCPCCRNIVHARAQKSKKEQQHYYHLNQSCDQESQIHWMYKHFLFEEGSKFYIGKELYEVKNIDIEKYYDTTIGKYKPDITVYTTNGNTFFFEIYFTSKKDEDYLYKWQELDIPVIEINIKELINTEKIETPVFEYLYNDGILYKKEYHKKNIYASTIGVYKEEIKRQDYLNYKVHWEKLDAYYLELSKYLRQEISERDIAAIFSNLDLDDMYPCYENIKRTNCAKHLKDFFNEQINNKVQRTIKGLIHNRYECCRVDFKKITDKTEYCIISMPYVGEYINITFELKSKITYLSKIHKLYKDDLLDEVYKLTEVLHEYYNKCLKLEEDLNELYKITNIKGYIDNINYIEYKEGYYEKNFFESILKFQTSYHWNNDEETIDVDKVDNTIYKYNFGCFESNEYLDNKRDSIIIDDIKEWVDTAILYENSKKYFSSIIDVLKEECFKDEIQDYTNNTLKSKNNIIHFNYIIYKTNLQITVYNNQASVFSYVITYNKTCICNTFYTQVEKIKLLTKDKIKIYCNNLIGIDKKMDYYKNIIINIKNQEWSFKFNINEGGIPFGELIIDFKNKNYKQYSVFPETINIYLEAEDKEVKENILKGMINLIKRAESHGLGLYNLKWWDYEKYIDEGGKNTI